MKRGYSKILYNQRNKDETIVSVIKRLFGEHISSRLIRMQNRELTFRCITYNLHRMLNLIITKWILQSHLLISHINRGIFATGPSGVIPIAVLKEESNVNILLHII